MKYTNLIFALLVLLVSCQKDQVENSIIETDNNGNILMGDLGATFFKVSELKKAGERKNEFYMQTLGFLPRNQNCNSKINVVVYPNPCPAGVIPKFTIKSDINLINIWFWGDNSPLLIGGPTQTKRYDEVISNNEGSKIYNFLVATSDSCAYEIEWNLVRR